MPAPLTSLTSAFPALTPRVDDPKLLSSTPLMLSQKGADLGGNLPGKRCRVVDGVHVKVFPLVLLHVSQPQHVGAQLPFRPQILHEGITVFAAGPKGCIPFVRVEKKMVTKIVFVGRRRLYHENRAHTEVTTNCLNHFLIGQPSVDDAFQDHRGNIVRSFLRLWLRPTAA